MKLIRMHRFGGPDVLQLDEAPIPTPGPGQVLIRVESASVNFADVMRRRNDAYPFPTTLPFTPGSEVAGTIDELGDGVDGPPVGTSVIGLVGGDGSTGYAQYALADARQIIPIPSGLGLDEACGVVVAGATAVLLLHESARLRAGETVVVPAAAGGVGSYAVQLAKQLGATVLAGASTPAKREAALALGADGVVDTARSDWAHEVVSSTDGRGADVVLEMAGGPSFTQGLAALAPFGRLVVYGRASGADIDIDPAALHSFCYDPSPNQSIIVFNLGLWFGLRPEVAGRAIETLLGHVLAGEIKVQVGDVLPLAQAADAHRMIEARTTTGKLVLKPWSR